MPATPLLRRTLVAASLLATAWPATASADRFHGTRSEKLVEQFHRIRLTLDHGVATMRVRRTVHNGGERHDQAMFWLDMPQGAVATGLRTQGTLRGKPHWFEGELLEAELAAARYRELTGIGGYYPKDPALLSWRSMDELVLQVFPVAPDSDKTVEYILTLPTVYEQGRDHLQLPVMGTDEHPAEIVLHGANRRDQLFVDDAPVAHGFPITLDDTHSVSLARHDAPTLEAHLASVPIDDDLALLQLEIAMAPKVSTIPRDARVVVVLDGSRSMDDTQRSAQLQAARAYLGHFADPRLNARAEVLVFDHNVEGRNGGLVSARKALADLHHLDLPGRNGSHVDDALERAGDLLARGKGPRRIVLFTDARTRAGLRAERLQALAERSKAIVHVAVMVDHTEGIERNDQHRWSEVARTTGGLVWKASTDVSDEEAPAVYEELARPLRLDLLQVRLPPLDDDDVSAPERLPEGEGFALLELASGPVDHLRVEGELWSRPVRETIFPDEAHNRRWAALVFGQELHAQLDDAQMMPLAMLGGAVSPVTSYLAIEPGVRPSTEGLDWGSGAIGFGAGGGSLGHGYGRGVGAGFGRKDLRQDFLDQSVRDALDACGGPGLAVRVTLESTLEEIVQVGSIHVPNADDPILVTCLEDGIWDVPLRSDFVDLWREWTVDLPGA